MAVELNQIGSAAGTLLSNSAIDQRSAGPQSVGAGSEALADLRGRLTEAEIARLLDSQLQRPDWHALHTAFKRLESEITPLAAYLDALHATARLAVLRDARWSTRYSPGSSHAEQVREALADNRGMARQQRLLKLFATDLHEQGVLNLNLMKYLLVLCKHEVEEHRFQTLLGLFKERLDGQTATA